ncbi:hypothetical protein L0337_35575 [candidate division KSB1 bacterium]|nr:hypothetical protein [candidate division KSB1 bacterium]
MKRNTLLAAALVLGNFALLSTPMVWAQNRSLSLALGTVRTEAEAAAIRYLVEYTQNLQDLFIANAGNAKGAWLLALTPNVKFETGEKDAFNGVIVKVTGNFMFFKVTEIDSIRTPDTGKLFHVLPISFGGETNRGLDRVNVLLEVGYVPWYQNDQRLPGFLRSTKVGLFLQAGYKFKVSDSTASAATTGGAIDESKEKAKRGLSRLKGSAVFNPRFMLKSDWGLGVQGAADGWYDIANAEVYYRIEAKAVIYLGEGKSFDVSYQKGSGAPNFNKGNQFSANITIQF